MKALILFSGGYFIFKFIINVYVYYSPHSENDYCYVFEAWFFTVYGNEIRMKHKIMNYEHSKRRPIFYFLTACNI